MIDHISKYTNRKTYTFKVYYKSGRAVTYRENDSLPTTAIDFILGAGKVTTEYHSSGKVERYYNR